MDEKKATKPKRTTRSRQASVVSPSDSKKSNDSTKKTTRSRKVKDTSENESAGSINDFDDTASSKSSNSNMPSCKVVLRREQFEELEKEKDERAIAHSTRARRSSQLTEENLAALVASPKRSLRSGSVISDKTESSVVRTRSGRLVGLQNTPNKEVSGSRTPARRSSRLLSENEKAADSPAKRNLRSNSIISEDISPPMSRVRNSSHLSESQHVTPSKSLKTKVSQIKTEISTPRRGSSRFNKSVLASDVIDEESSDNDEVPTKRAGQSKERTKSILKVLESETEDGEDVENEAANIVSEKLDHSKKEQIETTKEDKENVEEPEDVKPIVVDGLNIDITMSPASDKVPRIETPKRRSFVLIETNTIASPKVTNKTPQPITPLQSEATADSVDAVETSVTIQLQKTDTPKRNASKNVDVIKTPQAKSPRTEATESADLNSMDDTAMVTETILSPAQTKSKDDNQTGSEIPEVETMEKLADVVEVDMAKVAEHDTDCEEVAESSNIAVVTPKISTGFESMDESDQEMDKVNSLKDILKNYKNDAIETVVECSDASTPKAPKSRPSFSAFKEMNVSVLANEVETESVTPLAKGSPRRLSSKRKAQVNDQTKQISGKADGEQMKESPEKMDQSDLTIESSSVDEKKKTTTPKSNQIEKTTPKSKQIEKTKSPKQKTQTPQKQPTENFENSSPIQVDDSSSNESVSSKTAMLPQNMSSGEKSMSLEIDKIIAGLETPVISKENERRFRKIFAETTPAPDTEIDNDINAIATEAMRAIENDAPKPNQITSHDEQQNALSTTEAPEQQKEDSVLNDEQEMSVVNASQPDLDKSESPAGPEPENVAVSKVKQSDRKSVQIMTPKNVKSQSMQKRIDTPYPDENSILEASTKFSKSDERKEKEAEIMSEKRASAREGLNKLAESWSKSLKRISNKASEPIDRLGLDDESKKAEEDVPPKESVPARNNWGMPNGLVDSDSDADNEVVPDSEQESDEESEANSNEFVNDMADEVDDYNSGDSMDENERRDIEEHEIEETGEDLGSDDTEDDGDGEEEDVSEEEEEDDDGFLVDDDHVSMLSSEDDEEVEHEVEQQPKRRTTRIIPQSSSDESDEEISNGVSNDIVSVSLIQVESSVVVETNTNSEVVEIVEGKKFPTTYLTTENEEIVEKSKDIAATGEPSTDQSTKTSEELHAVAASNEPQHVDELETDVVEQTIQTVETSTQNDESNDSTKHTEEVKVSAEPVSASNEIQETAQPDVPTTEIDEKLPENGDHSTSLLQPETSSLVKLNVKGKDMAKKKSVQEAHRSSLPGIDRLPKKSLKKGSRVSLGDLDPNRTGVAPLEAQHKEPKTSSKKNIPTKKAAEPKTVHGEKASDKKMNRTSLIENVNSSASGNVPLNISSQEENNNQKSKDATDSILRSEEIETTYSEPEVPTASQQNAVQETVTVTLTESGLARANNKKPKRKFEEIDTDNEQNERPKLKVLKAISTASGLFMEEPLTPEKQNKHGFKETPLTPVNPHFRVLRAIPVFEKARGNKRKSIYLDEDEATALLLPKPRWQINTQFDVEPPKKRARKLEMGSTEVILQPLVSKKNPRKRIPLELVEFRRNKMNRPDIPRQDARALIREKQKRMFLRK